MVFISFIILVIFGSGWAEITRLGLGTTFMPFVAMCLAGFACGLVMIASKLAPHRIRDILALGTKRETPMWAGIIISFAAMLCFFVGLTRNDIGYYIISGCLACAVLIGVLRNILEHYEAVWKVAGKMLYIVGVVALGIYFAFVNVNLLYVQLGFLIVLGGLSYFTKYGKRIRQQDILADKYLTLYAIVVTIAVLLFAQLLAGLT